MPEVFQYLLKLSISLTVLYLFYFFVLRRLTFYSYNRWYLLGYSILSFFIAAINIAPFVTQRPSGTFTWVRNFPTVPFSQTPLTNNQLTETITVNTNWPVWNYAALIFIAGIIFLLVRLFVQFISFRKVKQNATLIPADGIKLYQVNAPIIPFSFGSNIYLNSSLHGPQELEKIIQHEFVHVKQKHTIDIICSEIICYLNWYNPFAWLIRKAIRQNLEYIADNQVIETGMNKKEYQYLLLKVMGNQNFSIATPFNFSSLKKRIAMMNKLKTSKVHALKFLFLLPLMATVLLAFRSEIANNKTASPFTYGGLVMDNQTGQPIANVKIVEKNSGTTVQTDNNGFFSFKVTDLVIDHQLMLEGAKNPVQFTYNRSGTESKSFLVLVKAQQKGETFNVSSSSIALEWDGSIDEAISRAKKYAATPEAKENTETINYSGIKVEASGTVMGRSGDKENQDMLISADTIHITMDKPKGLVVYNDKVYTAQEYKDAFNDKVLVKQLYFFSKKMAQKVWGEKGNEGVMMVNNNPAYNQYMNDWKVGLNDTIPKQKQLEKKTAPNTYTDTAIWVADGRAKHDDFMERHPEVETINWTTKQRNGKTKKDECFIKLTLQNGAIEKYNLLDDKDVQRFKNKYGELPVQAPPPPLPPTPAPISFSSKIPAHEYAVPQAPAYLAPKVAAVPPVPPTPPVPSTNRTSKLSPAVQQSLEVYSIYNAPRNANKPLSYYGIVTVQEEFVVRHKDESEKNATPITIRKAVVRNTGKK